MKRFVGLLLVFSFLSPAVRAFGKNQVNVHAFRWKVVRTAHFEIHHTDESAPLVPAAARLAEQAYDRLTAALGVVPAERTSLFIFSNHNQFEENNVVPVGEGTGGVTEAFKNRIVVFNNGSEFWLDHVITHEFVHVLEFEALYGGFWKSARLLKSPLYPLWFMEGLAEHGIGDMDRAEEDMYLRDAALDGSLYSLTELHGFAHLKPHQVTLAYKSGASAVRFLADEYGQDLPAKLLKGMRERFDVSSAVADLTRQDFRAFDIRWREHLKDYYTAQAARLKLQEPAAYGTRLTEPGGLPAFQLSPVLSPDGRRLAFLTDRNGPQEVALTDLETGVTRLLAGRQWGLLENIHAEGRSLSFSPDGRWLAFAGEKEQRDFLYLYDTLRDRLRRVRTPFEQVRSPAFHPAGDRLAIVGMKDGVNDLYEVSPRGKLLKRLTQTAADESDPAYSPDGKSLAFCREVPAGGEHGRDLAVLDTATLAVRFPPALSGHEAGPAWTPDGRSLVFVGEAMEGVRNLYRVDLSDGKILLLTRVKGGVTSAFLSADGKRAAFSSFRHNSQDVYLAGPSLWNPPAGREDPVVKGRLPREQPPAPAEAAALLGEAPYRFRASTDLFFPVLYYSSQDGLFVASLWQASEHLGHHQIQASVQYGSGDRFVDYNVQYLYKRFRPQFVVQAGGETFYQDFARIEQRREWERTLGVFYPLDRFRRIEVLGTAVHREDRFRGGFNFSNLERENRTAVSFVRDTSTGRYLAVTDGDRFRLTQFTARPVFGGTRDYDATQAELHRFIPTGGESALAFRGIAGRSTGPSPQLFRIGGGDRLRGYSRNALENQASRYVMGNLEWRVPLKYFEGGVALLPEIAFKAFFGTLFVDAGYDATPGDRMALGARRVRTSVGAGLRVPSFILQTYPVVLSMDIAKRTDRDDWSWYLSLGLKF